MCLFGFNLLNTDMLCMGIERQQKMSMLWPTDNDRLKPKEFPSFSANVGRIKVISKFLERPSQRLGFKGGKGPLLMFRAFKTQQISGRQVGHYTEMKPKFNPCKSVTCFPRWSSSGSWNSPCSEPMPASSPLWDRVFELVSDNSLSLSPSVLSSLGLTWTYQIFAVVNLFKWYLGRFRCEWRNCLGRRRIVEKIECGALTTPLSPPLARPSFKSSPLSLLVSTWQKIWTPRRSIDWI